MSKTCVITVWNENDQELDQGMLKQVLEKVSHHMEVASRIEIYPAPRLPNGWLEWVINIHHNTGPSMTIHAIQRVRFADYEFCT